MLQATASKWNIRWDLINLEVIKHSFFFLWNNVHHLTQMPDETNRESERSKPRWLDQAKVDYVCCDGWMNGWAAADTEDSRCHVNDFLCNVSFLVAKWRTSSIYNKWRERGDNMQIYQTLPSIKYSVSLGNTSQYWSPAQLAVHTYFTHKGFVCLTSVVLSFHLYPTINTIKHHNELSADYSYFNCQKHNIMSKICLITWVSLKITLRL